ncbi:MAG: hypothetical protein QXN71_01485 [Candidatus Aenigmatarchaeota archaeon]
MSDSIIGVIAEMVFYVLNSTADAIVSLFRLFLKLVGIAEIVSSTGALGIFVSAFALGLVLFFLWKFAIKSLKTIIILLVIGALLILAVFLS